MRRFLRMVCVLVGLGLASAACGSGSAAQMPTPRPSGQRGTLLNPIDKAHSTVDQLNNHTNQQEQQTGSGYP
jgi:hypothetical protein